MAIDARKHVQFIIISEDGVNKIKAREGLRLSAYEDGGGKRTIGYGRAHGVRAGEKITEHQATVYLYEDLDIVHKTLAATITVPLHQYEYDALMSFVYNIGSTAFMRSTLLKHLNEASYVAAKGDILGWCNVAGHYSRGLYNRRKSEQAQFAGS